MASFNETTLFLQTNKTQETNLLISNTPLIFTGAVSKFHLQNSFKSGVQAAQEFALLSATLS